MLVLTRRLDEQVFIDLPDGRRVVVMVVRIDGDKVKLGFDAPRDIQIMRDNAVRTSPRAITK